MSNEFLLSIFGVITGGLSTAIGMLWKFVQSRFTVQDQLLQNCEKKHEAAEQKYDRLLQIADDKYSKQVEQSLTMSRQVGEMYGTIREMRTKLDQLETKQGNETNRINALEEHGTLES